jgi:hypothetical protein
MQHVTLKFEPSSVAAKDRGSARMWTAADHKYAFTITRERNDGTTAGGRRRRPIFVARASRLDGTKQCQIGRNFKTFDAAVRLCSNFTDEFRRRIACHEAGHAVVGWLLGIKGVWVDMETGNYRSVTWHRGPNLAAVANGKHAVGALYERLLFSVAGLVAEEKIGGYNSTGYVEEDADGFACVPWEAIRVARLEAGLPICGHRNCDIPPDAGCDAARVAAVIKRAEDEAYAMLSTNGSMVWRVADALCKQDRLTATELDDLLTGRRRPEPTMLVGEAS